MAQELEFYHITLGDLPKEKVTFPFNLYLFSKHKKNYASFIYANTPLTKQKVSFLKKTLEQGNELAILANQKKTFMQFIGIKDAEDNLSEALELGNVPSETNASVNILLKNKQTLLDCIEKDDFTKIIEITRQIILMFPQTVSIDVNYAIEFTKKTYPIDTITNRILVFSYFLALAADIRSLEHMGQLLTATYLHHIGVGQLPPYLFNQPFLNFTDASLKYYQKHPEMSEYLIKKTGIIMNKDVLTIIRQHHERPSGNGFPDHFEEAAIHPLALLLGAASHLIEYSSGSIDGKKYNILNVMKQIVRKEQKLGLQIDFGQMVQKSFESILI